MSRLRVHLEVHPTLIGSAGYALPATKMEAYNA